MSVTPFKLDDTKIVGCSEPCNTKSRLYPTQNNYKEATSIEKGAFAGCPAERIGIPTNVKIIGAEAFKDCKNLDQIVIPDNVTNIEDNAFKGCTSLEEITIPEGVTFGKNVFKDCPKLKSVKLTRNGKKVAVISCNSGNLNITV